MTITRPLRVLVAVALAAALLPSCALFGGGDHYRLVAYFPRAISLYPSSDVKVLGLPAGSVHDVIVQGDRIRVELDIDKRVPVPKDVRAAIVPQSLIGERTVQLFPAWTEGQPKAPDGMEIPLSRSTVPVEPDEALAALKNFLDKLDPKGLGRLIGNAADDLEGNGRTLGSALEGVSDLVQTFASSDHQLTSIVDHFDELTSTLATREQQLGQVMDAFAAATQVLADERRAVERLVAGLGKLSSDGLDLVAEHAEPLKKDIEVLTEVTQALDVNLDSVSKFLDSGPLLVNGIAGAYNPDLRAINLRQSFSPLIEQIVGPLFDAIGAPLPCVPVDVSCDGSPLPSVPLPATKPGTATGQAASTPVRGDVSDATMTTPIDDVLALMAAPTAPPNAVPVRRSGAERVAGAGGALGRFFHRAAGALLGVGR
jgi:virulence factor Mce-like protein